MSPPSSPLKSLIYGRKGLDRTEKDVAGAEEIDGAKTGLNPYHQHPSTPLRITISIFVHANESPLAGQEGTQLTLQLIRERIYKEAETNVALTSSPAPPPSPSSCAGAAFCTSASSSKRSAARASSSASGAQGRHDPRSGP
ncbi:hypothetical protein FPV67DRAFT_1664046 [Lyophyllum atratum]|nr:hypothetical protein FPV67DRAFT_1683894 [Lyophyllum atratum]KAF8055447.1 hypothetical protein FPV67DRAFT_1680312 [Lyophyllum atratum]KAF8063151.1 hypothetical protein FPV67DRAFT_1672191 [Lyophyllum atratum]KAF8074885.1 hypothetical protein FPV67DRAFT_1665647 [Lyophyllum atratum]KAF8079414.1 hypothetical protein FPV67DRAFT_1664046 [Lyophyllum atratum]